MNHTAKQKETTEKKQGRWLLKYKGLISTLFQCKFKAILWSVLEPYSRRSLFTWKFQLALISSELFAIQIAKFLFDKVGECYKRTSLRIISIFLISWKKTVPLERMKIERNLILKENWSKIERIVPLALKWSGGWTRWFLKVLSNWITLFYWSESALLWCPKR